MVSSHEYKDSPKILPINKILSCEKSEVYSSELVRVKFSL